MEYLCIPLSRHISLAANKFQLYKKGDGYMPYFLSPLKTL